MTNTFLRYPFREIDFLKIYVLVNRSKLEVRSKPGRGAEFIIEIPIRHSKPLTSDPPPYKTMTTGSQTQSPIPEPQAIAATSNS